MMDKADVEFKIYEVAVALLHKVEINLDVVSRAVRKSAWLVYEFEPKCGDITLGNLHYIENKIIDEGNKKLKG
jgi:hypothetical protein